MHKTCPRPASVRSNSAFRNAGACLANVYVHNNQGGLLFILSRIEKGTMPTSFPRTMLGNPFVLNATFKGLHVVVPISSIFRENVRLSLCSLCNGCAFHTSLFLSLSLSPSLSYDGEFGFKGCAIAARLWELHGKCTSSTGVGSGL